MTIEERRSVAGGADEEAMSQECGETYRCWKRQGCGFSPRASRKEPSPADKLILNQGDHVSSDYRTTRSCVSVA